MMSCPLKHDSDFHNINHSLQVLTYHNEPFMYQGEDGQFFKGIEFQLITTIAKIKHLKLKLYRSNFTSNYNDLHSR